MYKHLFICALALTSFSSLFAQSDCNNGRYITPDLFPNVDLTTNVYYGENIGVSGNMQTLELDVYEPAGDSYTDRPVIVVGFGGSFVTGAKEDVSDICEEFAKLGYVAVAPNYRVGFFIPNAQTTSLAVMRGTHDMKAVVRYLHRSVLVDNDPWGIDTSRIIIGGFSAGAVSALHAVYLDEQSELPAALFADTAAIGNVPGNTGNLGFSDKVLAVWSMSGAIDDTLMIGPGDEPLVSVHEVGDQVVPYYTDEVNVLGIPTGLIASGSHDIHRYMETLGIENCFLSYPGNGHVGYITSDPAGSVGFLLDFFADQVCGQVADCGQVIAAVQEQGSFEFNVFPNPTLTTLSMDLPSDCTVQLYTSTGRSVRSERFPEGRATIDMSNLSVGMYLLTISSEQALYQQVVLKQ